jgi:hypothetical protein
MWQLGIYSFYYLNGFLLCPLMARRHGIRKHGFDSELFNMQLEKLAIFFFGRPKLQQP